ncbi:unnamed protein product, partial [Mesorhabditis spiculigera]
MSLKIILVCLVFGAVYAQHEPRKCQQGLPMCKFLQCLSTEYEGTATDHVATLLRNTSCNGELLLPDYEKLWNGWTDNDNRDLFKACGFEEPKNSTECRPYVTVYQCAISAGAKKYGCGVQDVPFIARLVQLEIAADTMDNVGEPHPCLLTLWEFLQNLASNVP